MRYEKAAALYALSTAGFIRLGGYDNVSHDKLTVVALASSLPCNAAVVIADFVSYEVEGGIENWNFPISTRRYKIPILINATSHDTMCSWHRGHRP